MSSIRANRGAGLERAHAIFLSVAASLSAIAGVQLFVLSDSTASYFAWTVNPPIAAAFFGAGFWAIFAAAVWGLWVGDSRQLDAFLPVAVVATAAILIASLLHLDRFHLTSPDLAPLVAAWVWLIVYVLVPLALLAYWLRTMMARGAGPAGRPGDARRPIPSVLRTALSALCIAAAVLAAIAFIAPTELRWPYPLTPLTARMTGAFLAALAAAVVVILLTDDLDRLRVASVTLPVFGILTLVCLVRFPNAVSTTGAGIWIYLGLFISTVVLGVVVFMLAWRAPMRRPAAT